MFCKKIETFSIDEITTLLRFASSKGYAVSDFEVFIFLTPVRVFASMGLRVRKCSKIGHARRMGNFTHEITTDR